jgi:hypothetical protein
VHFTLERHISGNEIDWLWPLAWLPNSISSVQIWFFCAVLIAANFLAIALPQYLFARFASAIAVLFLASAANSFGQVHHSDVTWIMVAFVIVFLPNEAEKNGFRLLLVSQAVILSTYFSSGIWKLLGLIKSFSSDQFFVLLAGTLPNFMAHSISGDGVIPKPIIFFFGENPLFSSLIWLLAIFFQLSTVVWLFKPDWAWFWGFFIILFHSLNVFLLGFQFNQPIMLAAFLFFVWPAIQNANQPLQARV